MTSTVPQARKKTAKEPVILKELWFALDLNREEHNIKRALRDDPNNAALNDRLARVHRLQECVQVQGNVIVQVLWPQNKPFDTVAYIEKFYATHPPKQKKQGKGLLDRLIERIR